MGDFHCGEGLDGGRGTQRFDSAQEFFVVGKRQIRMAATDDVDFGERLIEFFPNLVGHIFEGQLESLGLPLTAAESTETAAVDTDVGVVDVLVHHVGCAVAVPPPPHFMRQSANGVDVGACKKHLAVFHAQPLAVLHLVKNRCQP